MVPDLVEPAMFSALVIGVPAAALGTMKVKMVRSLLKVGNIWTSKLSAPP